MADNWPWGIRSLVINYVQLAYLRRGETGYDDGSMRYILS